MVNQIIDYFWQRLQKKVDLFDMTIFLIIPEQLSWKLDVNVLSLSFVLPPGCFATALLGEFLDFRVGLGLEQ